MSKIKNKRKKNNSNVKKNKLLYTILISACIFGAFLIFKDNTSDNNDVSPTFSEESEIYEASIFAVGDVMVHQSQLKAQYDSSTGKYDFENNFKHVKKYIEKADYSLANLETTLAGNEVSPYSAYPLFNSPDELADALKTAGFDLISTINNHSFDKGDLGVNRTLSVLKEKGFDTVGTRENSTDDEYLIKNINNIDVGITSYSYGDIINDNKYLNGIKISEECEDKMNVFDASNVDNAFETISSTVDKMNDTDIQIVILHWGIEYARTQTKFQEELAQKLCDYGVDVIIGSHPHVVEPVKTLKSSDGKNESVVIYSLGNYISNQGRNNVGLYSEDGLMVNIDIVKNSNEDKAKVKKVTCIPTWVNKYNNGSKLVYEIVPIENSSNLESMESLNKSHVKQSYDNTSSLVDVSDIITIVDSPFN